MESQHYDLHVHWMFFKNELKIKLFYLYLTLNSEWILGQIHNLIKFTYSQLKL